MAKQLPLVLPSLRGNFGDWIYYSCLMPLAEIGARVSYADEVHESKALSDLIQRVLEGPRAAHIAAYVEATPDRFFNSLVLAVYGGAPEWLDIGGFKSHDPSLRSLLSQQAEDSVGFLQLSGKEDIFAIDGQHRLAGIKKALAGGRAVLDEQVPVILVGHKKTAVGLQRTRRLFTTLNKTAVPVRKRDIIALDEDDVMAIIARRLVETDDRFRSPKIAVVASPNIPVSNQTCLTTITNLYDVLKILFVHISGRKSDRGLRFNRPSDDRLDEYHVAADEYFTALGTTFPAVRELFSTTKPETVTPLYRRKDGGHLLYRPVGLEIFTRTVVRRAAEQSIGLKDAVASLGALPMELGAPPYVDVLWDSVRGTVRLRGKSVARDLMAYMGGMSVNKNALLADYRLAKGLERDDVSLQLPPKI